MPQAGRLIAALAAILILTLPSAVQAGGFSGGIGDTFGPRFGADPHQAPRVPIDPRRRPRPVVDSAGSVQHWNEIAIDASGLDHTPIAPGENRVHFAEQLGPGRASRAMAIVHLAMFDAVNAIEGEYKSYTGVGPAPFVTSMKAAIAQAVHDTLVALFPSQAPSIDEQLADDLTEIPDGRLKANGIALGRRTAAAILAARANDGSQRPEPHIGIEFLTSNDPGKWRQDPISLIPLALGAYWGDVKPFVLERADQFRVPPPPALDSSQYTAAFDEVRRLGGCGNDPAGCVGGSPTPTEHTAEQTQIGLYWAYDGTPSLCAPPRLYNQITMRIAHKMGTDTDALELARLLALVNVAMADAGIAVWESKYYYQYWRPVTGIREADEHTDPTGLGDGNPATTGDTTYSPLGAPASNLMGPNFTPPFPAYPSGHAGFGGALFEMLHKYYRTDRIRFTFISDEFNGVTRDNNGTVRPVVERSFSSLSEAEEENGQSRIYLGIHWAFDKTEGIAQGRRVADYVFKHALQPRHQRGDGR